MVPYFVPLQPSWATFHKQSYKAMSTLFPCSSNSSFHFPFLWPACVSLPSAIVVYSLLLGNSINEQHWNLVNFVFMVAKPGNICFGRKICVREAEMFLTSGKNIFCFRAAKFVSATYVSRVAKMGNICYRNNVSATMFPSLARPLVILKSFQLMSCDHFLYKLGRGHR